MPEILEAWPTVAGLTFESFSATSFENPVTPVIPEGRGNAFPFQFLKFFNLFELPFDIPRRI